MIYGKEFVVCFIAIAVMGFNSKVSASELNDHKEVGYGQQQNTNKEAWDIMTEEITTTVTPDNNSKEIEPSIDVISEDKVENEDKESIGLYVKENCTPIAGVDIPYLVMTREATISGQWVKESNGLWWYRHYNGTYTVNNWEWINNAWYRFDSHGWMVTGWIHDSGYWYYCNSDGHMMTGWQYLYDNGRNDWYYFHPSLGRMQVGWIEDAYWYYCDGSGRMQKGWLLLTYNGVTKWYYFAPGDGRMAVGWVPIDRWYYFESSGAWSEERELANSKSWTRVFYTFDGAVVRVTIDTSISEKRAACENNNYGYPDRTAVLIYKTITGPESEYPKIYVNSIKHMDYNNNVTRNFTTWSKHNIICGSEYSIKFSGKNTDVAKYSRNQNRKSGIYYSAGSGGYIGGYFVDNLEIGIQ